MTQFELKMPKLGESIVEATVLKWLKKEGEKVNADESILEIATDKVDTEVPSPVSGIISGILAKEGEKVKVGATLAFINITENGSIVQKEEIAEPANVLVNESQIPSVSAPVAPKENLQRFYSPLVMSIAMTEGISPTELELIPGTGKENRVTKQDILAYIERKKIEPSLSAITKEKSEIQIQKSATPISTSVSSVQKEPLVTEKLTTARGKTEIIEMERMRKIIAERMVESKRISPHVTSFIEADVTTLVTWRNQRKEEFKKKEGENLTLTPIFTEAVVNAIKDFPMINVSVEGTKIILKKFINIGIAVALNDFNLIVPVLKNADRYNLTGLAKAVNDLSSRARNGKLLPDDLQDGTFTISNVGTFGSIMGTPIILQPQVAILATGAIRKIPAVIETSSGDTIGIRHKMFLSLSYDHRVVDGSLGGMFLKRVAENLEKFETSRNI
ncbi:MAG: hypothetical protein A3H98_09460 [Bacteroidetes bacterium RIFCSPLOWO2_02_FULL_36_8]|nr:MAG: hypothetical protein A3H98_09460 [Bacteroidetes bacterium RIFCSPLOWO2_02_FULL_36_8]OFY71919.1 MAG: hypothetical protein A3G23_05200 [Bacteroidetes bacterium RIFCSPLOWO2_12_FULL_37_12]